ncbi:MAG: hypothetical protein EOO11_09750, partial [Chitinophagaceae bacterium]
MPHPLYKISFPPPLTLRQEPREEAGPKGTRGALRRFRLYAAALALLPVLGGCELSLSHHSREGYLLHRPEIHFLEKKLSEISGINFVPGEASLIAITDDKRRVYRVYLDGHADDYFEPEIGPAADYEDVVKADSSVFVLVSNGALIEARRTDSGVATSTRFLFPPAGLDAAATAGGDVDAAVEELSKDVDFETLYFDSTARGLI